MKLHLTAAISFAVQAQHQCWLKTYFILCLPGTCPYSLVITVQMPGALHGDAVSIPESRSREGRVATLLFCLRHFEKHDMSFLWARWLCKAGSDILTWFEQGSVETGAASPAVTLTGANRLCFGHFATCPRKPHVGVMDCVSEGGPLSCPTHCPLTPCQCGYPGPRETSLGTGALASRDLLPLPQRRGI